MRDRLALAGVVIAAKQIGVPLEIETPNHKPDNCFKGLGSQYTLSVQVADIRDPDPNRMAGKIFEAVEQHRSTAEWPSAGPR